MTSALFCKCRGFQQARVASFEFLLYHPLPSPIVLLCHSSSSLLLLIALPRHVIAFHLFHGIDLGTPTLRLWEFLST